MQHSLRPFAENENHSMVSDGNLAAQRPMAAAKNARRQLQRWCAKSQAEDPRRVVRVAPGALGLLRAVGLAEAPGCMFCLSKKP